MIFITGDTHGSFDRIYKFSSKLGNSLDRNNDTMIILGDVGLNYYRSKKDRISKEFLSQIEMTFFCIHGNHEARPESLGIYREIEWNNGIAYVEDDFPNIIFAKDGEVYNIGGKKTLVIGGAYSIDKHIRIAYNYPWFSDEQPNDEIKRRVEKSILNNSGQFDCILTHTCPLRFEPREWFIKAVDQSKVDKTTEEWLDKVYEMIDFSHWYCGHYHGEKVLEISDKKYIEFMFESVKVFSEGW